MNNFILVIGASSFLGTNLIPYLERSGFVIRRVCQHLGDVIPYDELEQFRCVIYLKPDADQGLIDRAAKNIVPILSIGSGALVDYNAGIIEYSPYIEGKEKIVVMSSVTIHPGFFIPDITHIDTGRGLHRSTLMTLFSGQPIDASFNMTKAYYMTPVAKLIQMIVMYATDPSKYRDSYAFGTQMAITREELRDGAKPKGKPVYGVYMTNALKDFGLEITDKDIEKLRNDALAWVTHIVEKQS